MGNILWLFLSFVIFSSEDFIIDTGIVYKTSLGCDADVCFNGNEYLVVWEGLNGIFGTRVTQAGEVIDSSRICIRFDNWAYDPAVAFDGTNYLVVWRNYVPDSAAYAIYGARVSSNGNLIDQQPIVISSDSENKYNPDVVFLGDNYFVVWQDWNGNWDITGWDIYGARVTKNGDVLDASGIPISKELYGQEEPSIEVLDTLIFVVWEDDRDNDHIDQIYGARITKQGKVLDTAGILLSKDSRSHRWPALTKCDTNFFIVWSLLGIRGIRANLSGDVLDPEEVIISDTTSAEYRPKAGFDGTNYLVVWYDGRAGYNYDIYGARVSQSGQPIDPDGVLLFDKSYPLYKPTLGFDGTNYLLVFENWFYIEDSYLLGAYLTPSLTMVDSFLISWKTYEELTPRVGSNGTNFLVAWEDYRNGRYSDIFGARVSPTGEVLDPNCIPISVGKFSQASPIVTSNGSDYLVVWRDECDSSYAHLCCARINGNGELLDTDAILIVDTIEGDPSDACSDGTNYLVSWVDKSNKVWIGLISAAGVVLDTLLISNSGCSPSVTFGGDNYLLTWLDTVWSSKWYYYTVYGMRISKNCEILDTGGILLSFEIESEGIRPRTGDDPDCAFGGNYYFIVWRGEGDNIYCTRLTKSGLVVDTTGCCNSGVVLHSAPYSASPRVIFDGAYYNVVWKEEDVIKGIIVDTNCCVVDSFSIPYSYNSCTFDLVNGPGEEVVLLVRSDWAGEINNKTFNTVRIFGNFPRSVGVNESKNFPSLFFESYPNPFSKSLTIKFYVKKRSHLELKVYNIAGRLIKTLAKKEFRSGYYTLTWDGRDERGVPLPSGVYFCKLEMGNRIVSKKIVLIR